MLDDSECAFIYTFIYKKLSKQKDGTEQIRGRLFANYLH